MPKQSKKQASQTKDSSREIRILMEEQRSQFNTVAEQYNSIDRKLKHQEVALSKIEMEVQIVKSRAGSIDAMVSSIERELDIVKEAILDSSRRADRLEQNAGV